MVEWIQYNTNQASDADIPTAYNVLKICKAEDFQGFFLLRAVIRQIFTDLNLRLQCPSFEGIVKLRNNPLNYCSIALRQEVKSFLLK